jgi:molybdate transport system substrate-binding protein
MVMRRRLKQGGRVFSFHRGCWAAVLLFFFAAPSQGQDVLAVAADSSLRGALQELAQAWADNTDDNKKVELSISNVETLKNEVAKGAPWDVVILAGADEARQLTEQGKLDPQGQRNIARNELVVLGKKALLKDEEPEWHDLVRNEWRRMALGNPALTASGRFAQKAMEKRDLWDRVKAEARLAPTETLALDFARRNDADGVFIFRTDLKGITLDMYEVYPVDPKDHPPVLYVAAVVKGAAKGALGRDFMQFLVSEEAMLVWKKWGFPTGG